MKPRLVINQKQCAGLTAAASTDALDFSITFCGVERNLIRSAKVLLDLGLFHQSQIQQFFNRELPGYQFEATIDGDILTVPALVRLDVEVAIRALPLDVYAAQLIVLAHKRMSFINEGENNEG